MKTLLKYALAIVFASVMIGCDVDVEDEGELPDVDVSATPGEMPDVDVQTPDIDASIEEKEVTVPDIDVDVDEEKAKLSVPDIDVDVPEENEATSESTDGAS